MPKSKQNLKDKVEGNELDLSMCELTALPVDEMVKLTKVTDLDLSCNLLASIPETFCSMRNIVKLDLSKNYLAELPITFGNLINLQHLDLLSNKLHILPLTFAQLKNLKWLDLKDNPLDAMLQKAAGDCLDEAQCRTCAKNVILFMKYANMEMERKREREMEQEIHKAKQKKIEEERKRQQKKAEKERRKLEQFERQQKIQAAKAPKIPEHEDVVSEPVESGDYPVVVPEKEEKPESRGPSWCVLLATTFTGLLAVFAAVYIYCEKRKDPPPSCDHTIHDICRYLQRIVDIIAEKINYPWS